MGSVYKAELPAELSELLLLLLSLLLLLLSESPASQMASTLSAVLLPTSLFKSTISDMKNKPVHRPILRNICFHRLNFANVISQIEVLTPSNKPCTSCAFG